MHQSRFGRIDNLIKELAGIMRKQGYLRSAEQLEDVLFVHYAELDSEGLGKYQQPTADNS